MSSDIANHASIADVFPTVNNSASLGIMGTELGQLVRDARLAKGWSQVDLGNRVGKSQRWVSTVENGNTKMPRAKNLQLLADALDLDLSALYVAGELARTRAEARGMIDHTPRADTDPVAIIQRMVRKVDWGTDPSRMPIMLPILQVWIDQDRERRQRDAAASPSAPRRQVPSR